MKEQDCTAVYRYVRSAETEDYWSFLEWLVIARLQLCESTIVDLEMRQKEGDEDERIVQLLNDYRKELSAYKELKAFVDRKKSN
ncbi:hypothetical protein P4H71_28195 [Paenibacillus kribbensis]|uniref:hypothetical protein n=1 Tax=Paenibacillus kribbensis TaxID=172713 RepID=UPI002DB68378|nr:hypothetical protein [Paenibacillus kribbensis]MEC0238199.1 hypothetical protein [Paenibacillus kribbensis]